MRLKLFLPLLAALGLAACTENGSTTSSNSQTLNALTGESCILDRVSYQARTLYSEPAQLDCIGKHIEHHTGDHDDTEPCCEFPQPGCDENACCDADLVEPQGPPVF